ncbi:glycosyltransferase family 39 protein [bacterium]|nr:glycosyltransferase family 39 protein [bacterium]
MRPEPPLYHGTLPASTLKVALRDAAIATAPREISLCQIPLIIMYWNKNSQNPDWQAPGTGETTLRVGTGGAGRIAFLVFLAALALFLLGNGGHSLWDRDEARFSEATREMIETGDWIIPHLSGEIRYDKPILIYWLMSLPMRLGGVNAFSVRFPSAMAGALTVTLLFFFALRLGFGIRGALASAGAAALNVLLFAVSKAATTDAVLTCTVTFAFFLYWTQRRYGFSWTRHLGFYAVLALSALVKGPPGLAVVFLGVWTERVWAVWDARRGVAPEYSVRQTLLQPWAFFLIRTVAGLLVFFAISLPWTIAAWNATDGGFFRVAIGHHVIERAAGKAFEGHGGPMVYYILLLPILSLPFTPLLLNAMRWGWAERNRAAVRFLFSWFVPGLILFSVARTKLPHYMSPLMPSLALLVGGWWAALMQQRERAISLEEASIPSLGWWRAGAVFQGAIGLAAGIALPGAVHVMGLPGHILAPVTILGAVLAIGFVIGATFWWCMRPLRSVIVWTATMLLAFGLVLMWGLPSLEPLRPSPNLGRWLRENSPSDAALLAVQFKEPSLMFYARRHLEEMGRNDYEDALPRLASDAPTALVIPTDRWGKWKERYEGEIPPRVRVLFKEKFFVFTRGEWLDLAVVGNWDAPLDQPRSER